MEIFLSLLLLLLSGQHHDEDNCNCNCNWCLQQQERRCGTKMNSIGCTVNMEQREYRQTSHVPGERAEPGCDDASQPANSPLAIAIAIAIAIVIAAHVEWNQIKSESGCTSAILCRRRFGFNFGRIRPKSRRDWTNASYYCNAFFVISFCVALDA